MCGIAGIVNLDGEPVSSVILKRMTDVMSHRGPDGDGCWVEGNTGLGHRRLAIIDPSPAGGQPMISADHRYVLSYNGEVYNFRELRTELEGRGYWFRSNTDSEVVLYSFSEWGISCVERFNGMFAFALWDRKNRVLHIARDRYGIKPLYYGWLGNTFVFGSEQKALLRHPAATHDVDNAALYEYFTFQNIFTDRTLLRGIKMLPPATIGAVDTNDPGKGPELNLTRYWDYHFREPRGNVDVQEYVEELDRLLKQATSRQLVTDVELGSYLSGGMDSGTLTSIASRELPYIKTFTCGFDVSSASGMELAFDERAKAEAMSALYKTEHYEMVLKAGDMERCLPRFAWHLEEPRVGQSYPNFYVAQLASKFVKVVLSGAGGDELFGGYPWRYYRAVVNDDFEHYVDQYYSFWQRLTTDDELEAMFSPVRDDVKNVSTRGIFRDVFSNHKNLLETPEDYINHSLYFEAKTFLHGLLVVEDKLSMAHGLETRVPFLDNDIVDFAMTCPVGLKLKNLTEIVRMNENEPGNKRGLYFRKSNDGKEILRKAMKKYVPDNVAEADKQGFSSPDASWFKGESIEFVKNRLFSKNARIYEILDRGAVERLVREHIEGVCNRRLLVWSLLNVDEWLKSDLA